MRSRHGWRKGLLNSTRGNRKLCSRRATSSDAWLNCEAVCRQLGSTKALSLRIDVARVASPASPQLQALLFRPERLRNWNLDDAAGDKLAGLPADPFGAAAGPGELCGPDCFVCAW